MISKPGKSWALSFGVMPKVAVSDEVLGCRKRAEIPVYSFEKHARLDRTTDIYSPHVLILEGIFALYDPRVVELMDMKVNRLACVLFSKTDLEVSRFSVRPMQTLASRGEVSCHW